jgi:hypothetical protein
MSGGPQFLLLLFLILYSMRWLRVITIFLQRASIANINNLKIIGCEIYRKIGL